VNAIQLRAQIDFYNNLSKNARYYSYEYNGAVDTAMMQYMDNRIGDKSQRTPEMFQQVRDDLYTVIKTVAVTFTPGTAITNRYYSALPATGPAPTDYRDYALLMCLIDGYTTYARPTNFNESGPLLENSFMHPTNDKPYFNYQTTGFTLWRENSGTLTSATLTYYKIPNSFNVGLETQLINGGPAVTLTNLATYYATEQSIYNGVTYALGATITGVTGYFLTSGQVILASNTTPCELPADCHDEIALLASKLMLGAVSNYEGSMFSEKEEKG